MIIFNRSSEALLNYGFVITHLFKIGFSLLLEALIFIISSEKVELILIENQEIHFSGNQGRRLERFCE